MAAQGDGGALDTDVVVVGGGGAGLAAAIEARAAGARVVLLEKNPRLGGTTAHSIGSITAATTRHQAREGIVDTTAGHLRDIALFGQHVGRPDNVELCRVLTENVPETLRWLEQAGVAFFGPLEEPPHSHPRMHNVVPNSRAYIYHLERLARRNGVRIVVDARARRLVSRDGRIAGIEFETAGRDVRVATAARAVVLAAGDYAGNAEMKKALISDAAARTDAVNPASTGDGIRLGLEAGGRIVNPDLFGGGARFVPPAKPSWISQLPPSKLLGRSMAFAIRHSPAAILRRFAMGFLTTVMVPARELYEGGAVLINRNGERFADEAQALVATLPDQPDGVAYILLDGRLAEQFSRWPHFISTAPGVAFAYVADYERNRPDLVAKADSLAQLARNLRIDPARLEADIARYNAGDMPSTGASPRGKRPPLAAPPFYALGPVRNYVNYTDGGLAVNGDLQVLGPGDAPIDGLYAAGSNGQGGLLLKGHGHHLGWAFTSGRIAGRNAAHCHAAA